MMSTRREDPQEDKANRQRDLAGLLGGLLGGQLPATADTSGQGGLGSMDATQGNDVANVLGGLLGGGGQAGQAPAGSSQGSQELPQQDATGMGGGDLGGLLGALVGGGASGGMLGGDAGMEQQDTSGFGAASAQDALGGGDLGGLLGGLLGGGMGGAASAGSAQQAEDPFGGAGGLGGLLGGLLGGGMGGGAASGGGLGGLLGGLIGSNQASSAVAQQTGLAPTLVQALLPMIVGLLARGGQRSNMRDQGVDLDGDGIPDVGDQAMQVVQRIQQGQQVDPRELRSTGIARALARQSGYPEEEVAPAAVQILEALARQNQG